MALAAPPTTMPSRSRREARASAASRHASRSAVAGGDAKAGRNACAVCEMTWLGSGLELGLGLER